MTDPVILLGTQSNGETLPVQVDGFGRLVAEGLQGPEGPEGPQGPPGPEGPSFVLPPDPYEGALLGWLNNELAWVGTPPVPIPPGVFGPIVSWDPNSGFLDIEGPIPDDIGPGVYVYQCDEQGNYYTAGWNTSQVWSDFVAPDTSFYPDAGPENLFDGNFTTGVDDNDPSKGVTFTPPSPISYQSRVRVLHNTSRITVTVTHENNLTTVTDLDGPASSEWFEIAAGPNTVKSIRFEPKDNNYLNIRSLEADGILLVDTNESLNLRVNQILGTGLLGVASNSGANFSIGKYLFVPSQRVAPWLLYGNDPTSLIDHLRSS